MTMKRKAIFLASLVALLVLALGGAAFAQSFGGTQGDSSGGTVDLGPGMSTANGATGGGLEAAAIGELGDTSHGPIVEDLLDLPALNVGVDAEGRVVMDLPGLKLVGPAKGAAAGPGDDGDAPAPDKLPVTGANVGDIFALGLAALSGGGVLLRRLRVGLAA